MKFYYPCKPNTLSPDSKLFTELDNDPEWIAELKKNGIRCLVEKENGKVILWNRFHRIIKPYPEIIIPLRELPDGIMLDGELIAKKGETPKLFLFDLIDTWIWNDGLIKILSERRSCLEEILKPI